MSDDPTDDGCEVIDMAVAAKALSDDRASIHTTGARVLGHCSHYRVTVDRDTRSVACQKCAAEVDPVDFLLQLAHKESQMEWIKEKLGKLRESVEELKREERNVKARIRRAKK